MIFESESFNEIFRSSFSPDGKNIIFADNSQKSDIRIYRIDANKVQTKNNGSVEAEIFVEIETGTHLFDFKYVIDAKSKKVNNIIDLHKTLKTNADEYLVCFNSTYSISPDSSKIAINVGVLSLNTRNEIYILNLDGTIHKKIYESRNKSLSMHSILWSPDGKYILYNECLLNCTKIIKIDPDSESEYDVIVMDKFNKPIEGEPLFWYANK